jgi:hypothetical protein
METRHVKVPDHDMIESLELLDAMSRIKEAPECVRQCSLPAERLHHANVEPGETANFV